MFDVFYLSKKPNLFVHERRVANVDEACVLSRTRFFWIANYLCDYSHWDWFWEPPPWQAHQRHAWRSQWQQDCGTYLIPRDGYHDTNYHEVMIKTGVDMSLWRNTQGFEKFDFSWHHDYSEPAYQYHFGTQWQRAGGPIYDPAGATTIKIVPDPRAVKCSQDQNWEIDQQGLGDPGFDWTWHPDPLDPPFVYQFGTQHQKTGGPRYRVAGACDVKYVDQIQATVTGKARPVIVIDHVDGSADEVCEQIKPMAQVMRTVRYVGSYLDTLRRIAALCDVDQEHVWICSSVCDYSTFDFSWHPEQWQAGMLHVFASDDQKFGDTFLMHVPSFRQRASSIKLLEWYDVNFVPEVRVARRPCVMVQHASDSQVDAVRQHEFSAPSVLFTVDPMPQDLELPAINLWRSETQAVISLDPESRRIIVPRLAQAAVNEEIYDYAYIDKSRQHFFPAKALDCVFLSNGEPWAERHWQLLNSVAPADMRMHHIQGVQGRVKAMHAAALAATTTWFFLVPAKLAVCREFDWDWRPDRLQQPKHYIFHARNPVNGLEYGHMAMIAYNRQLVLATNGQGLDFALEQCHQIVPVNSGTAWYNQDALICWRTAFREVIKLLQNTDDVESQYRLQCWLTQAQGHNHEWSLAGAYDAREYYQRVAGDLDAIKLSYEWQWLDQYCRQCHPELGGD